MKQRIGQWLRSFPQRYPWFWRNAPYAILTGIVLAFFILAAIPQSACIAGCGARDKWCNHGGCSPLTCKRGTRVRAVINCAWDAVGGVCGDVVKRGISLKCLNGSDCNASVVDPAEYRGRLFFARGRAWWKVGACSRNVDRDHCNLYALNINTNIGRGDCCSGGGGGGGGCTPNYQPPQIDTNAITIAPPYPLVYGQEPDKVGVTVSVQATGGEDKNHCGGGRAKITAFSVTEIDLAQSSRDWILHTLALYYPGAHIKGDYPMLPDQSAVSGLNTPNATLTAHFNPLDPGYYVLTIAATQNKGKHKTTTVQVKVPVSLLQTEIIH